MRSFLGRRVVSSIITLFLFVTILFFLAELLIPGDFVTQFTLGMAPAERAELRKQLGLNESMWTRYWWFVRGLARGDLGTSYWGESVLSVVGRLLPWTLLIFSIAMGLAFTFGFYLGKVISWRRPSRTSSSLTVASAATFSIFPPLLVFFLVAAVWFPRRGRGLLPDGSRPTRHLGADTNGNGLDHGRDDRRVRGCGPSSCPPGRENANSLVGLPFDILGGRLTHSNRRVVPPRHVVRCR